MCGIIGYINTSVPIDSENFESMRDTMIHRGPDGKGAVYFKNNTIALGHRRLSIIDLSENGSQPMLNDKRNVSITFNGEIYNYKELKEELKDKYNFKSTGDTEVLLNGYIEWGIDLLLKKLNGMYSFGIWDEQKNKLFIARDRIGIKPLYYYLKNNTFIFSSEIKAIKNYKNFSQKISSEGLSSYLMFRYIISPYTIYDDCYKLEPGHYACYDYENSSFEKKEYWNINNSRLNDIKSEEEIISEIGKLTTDAVKIRALASDVPVHTFLSGGIDSSLTTALLKKFNKKIQAYSIEVVDEYKNEIEDAKVAANHIKVPLHSEKLTQTKFDSLHNEVISKFDEPMADTSNVPTYFLCELASKSAKVALSGDGGDELFYGYSWYKKFNETNNKSLNKYLNLCLNTFNNTQIKDLIKIDKTTEIKSHFISKINSNLNDDNIHLLDFHTFMVDDILTKVDTASMCHSLEVRVPFLDHRLAELAFSIPHTKHYKDKELKYLLKKFAEKHLKKRNNL